MHIYIYVKDIWTMFEFSSVLGDGSDIHGFPACHVVKVHYILKNHGISEQSLSILEKFKCKM